MPRQTNSQRAVAFDGARIDTDGNCMTAFGREQVTPPSLIPCAVVAGGSGVNRKTNHISYVTGTIFFSHPRGEK